MNVWYACTYIYASLQHKAFYKLLYFFFSSPLFYSATFLFDGIQQYTFNTSM